MNRLADLTPEDWAALAALPEGADHLAAYDDRLDRWERAGITVGAGRHRITPFGQGVIAAARVLVKRAEPQPQPQPGLMHCPYGGICALCTTTCAEARARARDRLATPAHEGVDVVG